MRSNFLITNIDKGERGNCFNNIFCYDKGCTGMSGIFFVLLHTTAPCGLLSLLKIVFHSIAE